jgi:hypothetical protein
VFIVPAAAALAAAGWYRTPGESRKATAPAAHAQALSRDFRECPGPYWGTSVDDRRPQAPAAPSPGVSPGSGTPTTPPATSSYAIPPYVAVARITTKVPEFHDCQRFIVKGRRESEHRYDSLFAVFASDFLWKLADSLGRADSSTSVDEALDLGPGDQVAIAAGEVFTRGVYPSLGIGRLFNCLYMSRGPRGWRAFMLPVGADESACLKPMRVRRSSASPRPQPRPVPATAPFVESSAATELRVRAETFEGFTGNDIPAVARWDWDPRTGQYSIGLKCGAAWCEVGPRPDFASSPGLSVNAAWPKGKRRVHRIKGWYDEQWLAVPNIVRPTPRPGANAAAVRPAVGLMAQVIPDSLLKDRTKHEFVADWVQVATIRIPDVAGVRNYTSKLGLRPGENQLFLKGEESSPNWRARVVPPVGAPTEFDVIRHDHSADVASISWFRIPATTRWRWMPDDETIWARCLEGCCEVQSKGSSVSASPP